MKNVIDQHTGAEVFMNIIGSKVILVHQGQRIEQEVSGALLSKAMVAL